MEITRATFIAGLPIALLSFALVFWAIKKRYISPQQGFKGLKHLKNGDITEIKDADGATPKLNRIHQKWLYFGGGFYGMIGFITYLHVEFLEIHDFVGNFGSISQLIDQISIGAIIRLIVDSFMNLIPAFTWFLYWPKVFVMQNGWYWLIAAYIGYHIGARAASWWVINQQKH